MEVWRECLGKVQTGVICFSLSVGGEWEGREVWDGRGRRGERWDGRERRGRSGKGKRWGSC